MDRTWPRWAEKALLWLAALGGLTGVLLRFAASRLPELAGIALQAGAFGVVAGLVLLVVVQHTVEMRGWWRAGWSLEERELVFRYVRSEVRVDRSEILAVCLPRVDRGPHVTLELTGDRGMFAPLIDPVDVEVVVAELGLASSKAAANVSA